MKLAAALGLVVAAVTAGAAAPASRPRACLATDLAATASFQGGTGSAEGGVVVVNRSASRCVVFGRPLVDVLANGQRLATRQVVGRATKGRRVPRFVALTPQRGAFVHIRCSNWCGVRDATFHLRLWIQTVRPRVAVRGSVGAPRCDDPAGSSTVSVGPFEPVLRH